MTQDKKKVIFIFYFLSRFLDPLFFGDYPAVMRKEVGNRLPCFSEAEAKALRGSLDFVGLNHYTTRHITPAKDQENEDDFDYMDDQRIQRLRKFQLCSVWLNSEIVSNSTTVL